MRTRFALVVFVAAVLVGTFLRAQDLLEPYEDRHRGASAALFALMAKNHLRYGFATTGGVGVVNPDRCEKEHFKYYAEHPQGAILLATLGAMLGGTQSGLRLVFLPLAIGVVFLVHRLARKRGPGVAATAGGIAALTPLGVYYGAFVSFEIPTLFFLLLSLQLLLRYGRRRRRKDLVRGTLAFFAAAFCDWIALALLPALLVAVPLVGRRRTRRPGGPAAGAVLLYGAAGGLAVLVTALQFTLQPARFGLPIEFSWRSIRFVTPMADGFTWADWGAQVAGHATALIGAPLLALALVGLARVAPAIGRRRLGAPEAAALAMLLVGLANLVLLGNHARERDFALLYLLPAVALLAARAFPFERVEPRTLAARALNVAVVALLTWQTFRSVELLEARRGFELNARGEAIRDVTHDGDIVLLVDDKFTLQVTVAADRYLDSARDLAQLEVAKRRARLLGMAGRPLVVLVPKEDGEAVRPEFVEALERLGRRSDRGEYVAFELGRLE